VSPADIRLAIQELVGFIELDVVRTDDDCATLEVLLDRVAVRAALRGLCLR